MASLYVNPQLPKIINAPEVTRHYPLLQLGYVVRLPFHLSRVYARGRGKATNKKDKDYNDYNDEEFIDVEGFDGEDLDDEEDDDDYGNQDGDEDEVPIAIIWL